jgi:hypothetical protein
VGSEYYPVDAAERTGYVEYRGACLRACGRLEDLAIIESLKPKGSRLSATGLHPWV